MAMENNFIYQVIRKMFGISFDELKCSKSNFAVAYKLKRSQFFDGRLN